MHEQFLFLLIGNMKTSILDELHIALNNYDSLDEEIKDLIAVHNSAIESTKERVI